MAAVLKTARSSQLLVGSNPTPSALTRGSRSFTGVLVEPLPGLHPESAPLDVGAEELARTFWQVRVLRGVVVLDVQDDVEPDGVHHLEGTARHPPVDLEHAVDVLVRRRSLRDDLEGLALDGRPDA